MRDNNKDPRELTIVGWDTDDLPGAPGYDAESNAIPDTSPIIQNIKRGMEVQEIGAFGAIVTTQVGATQIIIAGRKRARALRLVNVERAAQGLPPIKIACDFKRFPPERRNAMIAGLAVMENYLRHTSRGPLAPVRQAIVLLNAGNTVAEISAFMGVTQNGVRRWLKINDLCPKVQDAVERDLITSETALMLHGLPEPEQEAKLAVLLAPEAPAPATPGAPVKVDEPVAPGEEPVESQRDRLVKKKRGAKADKPKRVGKKAAEQKLGGNGVQRRKPKTVLSLMGLPRFTGSEEFRRGARWAIGDLSDDDAGVLAPLDDDAGNV